VLELGEEDARILLVMRHGSGAIAASFQAEVAHATAREGRPFPWPERVRARAEALCVTVPEGAGARSIPLTPVTSQASLPRALELGLQRIGLGVIGPDDCDAFGRMRPHVLMARISAGVSHLFEGRASDAAAAGRRVGGVALEYRLAYYGWPRLGDRFELRSSAAGGDARVRRVVHWFLDPLSGAAWGAAEATIAAFDLDERKILAVSAAEVAAWDAAGRADLTL
jgi:acyl-CoA thioester hydrolase